MVVITLSTALVFALVVFPAMCGAVGLTSHDTGSVRALCQGRFRAFLGRSKGGGESDAVQMSGHDDALTIGQRDIGQSGLWGQEVAAMGLQSDQGGLLHCQSLARSTMEAAHPTAAALAAPAAAVEDALPSASQ
jgi:hypothetical protein